MFDLNLRVSPPESYSEGVETESEKFLEDFDVQVENSGISNSSVVNVDTSSTAGDVDSCSDHLCNGYAIGFGILESFTGGDEKENRCGVLLKELFPKTVGESKLEETSREQWLDLSGSFDGSPKKTILTQQQGQVMRKSRRGPRSRTSQYRGVTFYRRTGRWESHIWDLVMLLFFCFPLRFYILRYETQLTLTLKSTLCFWSITVLFDFSIVIMSS